MCENRRVTIKDIAEEMGLSTATISNVINGKTKKISDKTVERVQKVLDEKQYIPNMAGILLAQNSSKIICIIISNHKKYEENILQDPFVSSLLDSLSLEIEKNNYFMMIKVTENISEIVKYSSMWNMAGLFLIGFCEQDYDSLRKRIHIPFVVMDGFFEPKEKCGNVSIDDFAGGYLMGKYLISKGHENIMYMSDNNMCMDHKRYLGLIKALDENNVNKDYLKLEIVPFYKNERINYYKELENNILNYTAIFCASDKYAIEIINYLTDRGYNVPNDVSVVGFDDIPASEIVRPALTTIRQNMKMRAEKAMLILTGLINKNIKENNIILPVELIERDSVKSLLEGNK